MEVIQAVPPVPACINISIISIMGTEEYLKFSVTAISSK